MAEITSAFQSLLFIKKQKKTRRHYSFVCNEPWKQTDMVIHQEIVEVGGRHLVYGQGTCRGVRRTEDKGVLNIFVVADFEASKKTVSRRCGSANNTVCSSFLMRCERFDSTFVHIFIKITMREIRGA